MVTSPLKIGYCLSLSGALASNGKTAQLAHQIWLEKVNKNGKLLGRRVELVCLDDQTNPNLVADLYRRLLDVEKVDVVVGGYGDNSVAPAMPLKWTASASFYSSPNCVRASLRCVDISIRIGRNRQSCNHEVSIGGREHRSHSIRASQDHGKVVWVPLGRQL